MSKGGGRIQNVKPPSEAWGPTQPYALNALEQAMGISWIDRHQPQPAGSKPLRGYRFDEEIHNV